MAIERLTVVRQVARLVANRGIDLAVRVRDPRTGYAENLR